MSAAPTSNKGGQNGVANGNSSQDANCTLLVGISKNTTLSAKDVKDALENGDLVVRADALEQLIRMHLNGESQNHMIMTVIRYITPIDDHLIKKLLLYFWEVVDKTDEEGKLLSVMILICDFLRKDLIHPNEYIRGITLRFLSRLTNREIIEPLVSNILLNLTHRVAYVRRNAVLAIHSIYVKFPELLPDAIEHVEKYMVQENDVSALRNAFDMIAHFAPEHASQFLSHYFASHVIEEAGGGFLMSAVDFCQTRIAVDESNKAQYVPILFSILQSKNFAVRFQCANTLLSLSSSPTAIRQALLTFIQLLKTHSDNSVKLIVIDRLEWMRHRYLPSMQNAMKDVLSALQDGSLEVRSRIIGLASHLITSQNVNVFVQAVRTELNQVQIEMNAAAESATLSAASSYKLKLIHAINTTIRRYPNVADGILPLLLDYICESVNTSTSANSSTMNSNPLIGSNTNTISGELSYSSSSSSVHVAALIKETLQLQPSLRHTTLIKLHEVFQLISSSEVLRMVLWILGAYAERNDEIISTLELIQESMEPFPLTKNNTRNESDELTIPINGNEALSTQPEHGQASLNTSITSTNTNTNNKSTNVKSASLPQPNVQVTTTVREDGTYATTYNTLPASTMNNNSSSTSTSLGVLGGNNNTNGSELIGLRAFIVNGQFFLASALASTLTKLIIRLHFNRHGNSAHNSSTTNINNNKKNVKGNTGLLSDDRTLTSEEIAHWTRVSTDMLNEVLRYGISYSSSTTTVPSTHDADGNANAESETIMPLLKVGMDEDTHTHLRLALSILSRPEKYFCMRYLEYSTRAVENEQVTFASPSHFPASHTKTKGSVASIQKLNAQQHANHNVNNDNDETRYAHIKHMNFTKPISFSLLEGDMMPSLSEANNSNNSRYPSYYEDAEDSYDTANHTNYMNGFHNGDSSSATANNLMGMKPERVATGFGAGSSDSDEYSFLRELEKVVPYSGCDDEVYCEASISLKHFDVSINWSLTNTTATPFKNVCIELASLGGMKLFERPKYYDLPANSTIKIRTSLKASAAETGVVFAALIYESEFKPTEHKSNNAGMGREFAPEEIRASPSFQLGGNVINYVPLMDVHIDIMNYVKPATCTASEFREKWRSYDWENKINVSVTKKTLRQYLRYIAKQLNMNLLDPLPVSTIEEMSSEEDDENKENADVNHNEIENKDAKGNQDANYNSEKEIKGKEEEEEEEEEERCEYVSTNLYARTIFGEDALANVSVERDSKGTITGIIRIRSNTQSVAYGIGEKINLLSKEKQI